MIKHVAFTSTVRTLTLLTQGWLRRFSMRDKSTLKNVGITALFLSAVILVSALSWKKAEVIRDLTLPTIGSVLIQLGAYKSRNDANEAINKIRSLTGSLTEVYDVSIVEVEQGSERFFRLRLYPFSDLDDASSLCEKLASWGVMCVPVKQND